MRDWTKDLHKVKIDPADARAMAQWCCKNLGTQGNGWWRTGLDEFGFADADIAANVRSYIFLGLSMNKSQ